MKKIVLLVCIQLISLHIFSQEAKGLSMTFDHLALSVADVDVSAEFYKSNLNLSEITNKTQKKDRRWLSLGDGKELHLIAKVKGKIKLSKAVHFAVTTSHFDAFINLLNYNKIPYSSWDGEPQKITLRADGIQQVYIQDPDGYWIEVNSVKDTH